MQFSTASKKPTQDTTSLFVALYLILLAFFIILTKDLSFDDYKQTIAIRSLQETFGRPKEQQIVFGRLDNVKIEDFSLQLEEVTKKYGAISTSANEDRVKVKIPLSKIYYADEATFRNEKMDDMMTITHILRRWSEKESLRVSVYLNETKFEQDAERLKFFQKRIGGLNSMIGLRMD